MTDHDPIAKPAANPVHRREPHAHQYPDPVHFPQGVDKRRQVVAVYQDGDKTTQRYANENDETAEEDPGREDIGHGPGKLPRGGGRGETGDGRRGINNSVRGEK